MFEAPTCWRPRPLEGRRATGWPLGRAQEPDAERPERNHHREVERLRQHLVENIVADVERVPERDADDPARAASRRGSREVRRRVAATRRRVAASPRRVSSEGRFFASGRRTRRLRARRVEVSHRHSDADWRQGGRWHDVAAVFCVCRACRSIARLHRLHRTVYGCARPLMWLSIFATLQLGLQRRRRHEPLCRPYAWVQDY